MIGDVGNIVEAGLVCHFFGFRVFHARGYAATPTPRLRHVPYGTHHPGRVVSSSNKGKGWEATILASARVNPHQPNP